jgi:hypothetical protein
LRSRLGCHQTEAHHRYAPDSVHASHAILLIFI